MLSFLAESICEIKDPEKPNNIDTQVIADSNILHDESEYKILYT